MSWDLPSRLSSSMLVTQVTFHMFVHVCSESHRRLSSFSFLFTSADLFSISTLSCTPYSCLHELWLIQNTLVLFCKEKRTHLVSFLFIAHIFSENYEATVTCFNLYFALTFYFQKSVWERGGKNRKLYTLWHLDLFRNTKIIGKVGHSCTSLVLWIHPNSLPICAFLSRWIKFEEKVEKGGERWSKPHVATLSLHSLMELKTCIEKGTIMLDLEASTLPQVVGKWTRTPANPWWVLKTQRMTRISIFNLSLWQSWSPTARLRPVSWSRSWRRRSCTRYCGSIVIRPRSPTCAPLLTLARVFPVQAGCFPARRMVTQNLVTRSTPFFPSDFLFLMWNSNSNYWFFFY